MDKNNRKDESIEHDEHDVSVSSNLAGKSPKVTHIPVEREQSRMMSLGGYLWFDIPIMLTILALGSYVLFHGALDRPNMVWGLLALGIYSGLNLLQASQVPVRAGRTFGITPQRTADIVTASRFLCDLAFVSAVTIVDQHDDFMLTTVLLALAGARFLAHIAGRSTTLILPVVALPLALVVINTYGRNTSEEVITSVLLLVCCLIISNTIFSKLNPRIAEGVTLAAALAVSDQSLKMSEVRAQLDAENLAREVLRLDLLQDSIRAMNSAIELDALLAMVVENAVHVLNAEQSSIGLVDPETQELIIRAATGVDASELQRRRFPPGVGVGGWVVKHGEPLIVADVEVDSQYIQAPADHATSRTTRSMLCVPLKVEQRVIGALCVTHSQPGALSAQDQSLLMSFADQAALAVHKSQLLEERTRQSEELRRRGELISTLHSIGQSVLSSLDLPRVLNTIISRVGELSSFDYGAIYLLDDETGQEVQVARTEGGDQFSDKLLLKEGSQGMDLWVRARGGTIAQGHIAGLCVICLPLVNFGQPIGCIILGRKSPNPFNQQDHDSAEKLAEAATIAIINAKLFSTVSQQQQQTAALYRMILKVNAASNRKQLAQVICHELGQMIGVKAGALLMDDGEQSRMSVLATSGAWASMENVNVSIPAQGDPFVSTTLAELHRSKPDDLLIIQNAPHGLAKAFGSTECVTIPLAQGHRLYGLYVMEPETYPAVPAAMQEMIRLAISNSTVALERAVLYDQSLTAARESSMLYSVAAEVQTSLDPARVMQMTVNSAMEALPIQSCEIYTFDEEHSELRRSNMAASSEADNVGSLLGPSVITVDSDPALLEVLNSPGLLEEQPLRSQEGSVLQGHLFDSSRQSSGLHTEGLTVLWGRLMGSSKATGAVRLTTLLPVQEFVHRHAAFCQTLLTHSGGAIERSRLYTTVASQAQMLHQRAQQLTDILNLGSLSAADVPLETLLPQIGNGIANSLDFAYVRIGEIGPDSTNSEVWASGGENWSGISGLTSRALSLDSLEQLLEAGESLGADVRGACLDEAMLASVLPSQPKPKPGVSPRQLALVLLESTGGGTLGYILAALKPESQVQDLVEVLSIFAQELSLILENHRVYSQLLDSKRKIDAVVLSIDDAVIVTDAELNILISNSLANTLLGLEAVESMGQPLKQALQNDTLNQLLQDCLASSKSGKMDVEFQKNNETYTYEAAVHSILTPQMDVLGIVLTLTDVTIARATERAKSDFLSMVSHELRTPLNSVLGFLDIILMGKTGQLTDLQSDFLGTARQEAGVLQRLINDLLDYSQLHSGMLRMELVPMNLSAVMARVVNQAIPRMQEDQLSIVNNLPAGLLIVGDEIRLEQVFKNLLDNAAKSTEPGGEITFGSRVDGDKVTISVSDNGCGIPAGQVSSVFERFFQAESSSSRRRRGLGLGLPICKNIIEGHGGKIWVESQLGIGTTVYVELNSFDAGGNFHNFDLSSALPTQPRPVSTGVQI